MHFLIFYCLEGMPILKYMQSLQYEIQYLDNNVCIYNEYICESDLQCI